MTATTSTGLPPARHAASRIGLVVATLLALPNLLNGANQVVNGPTVVAGEPTPAWVGLSLAVAGLVTLVFLVPAWRGRSGAIWAVAASRFSEVSALAVFTGAVPVVESEKPVHVVVAVIAVAVGSMVLLGLRPRR